MTPEDATRLKYVVSQRTKKAASPGLPRVDLEHVDGGKGRLIPSYEPTTSVDEACTRFGPGDVLFSKLRPYLRKSVLCDFEGCCTTELLVLRPEPHVMLPGYLAYIVQSEPFISWAVATSEGAKMPRTNWEALGNFRLPVPALDRQQGLVDRLDAEVAAIDKSLAQQASLIELVRERERAVISERFDRAGSDWVETRLKFLLRAPLCYGVLKPEPGGVEEEGVPLVRVFNVTDRGVRRDELLRITKRQALEYRRTLLRPGDVAVSVVGTLGRTFVVDEETEGCNLPRAMARVQPADGVDPHFLHLWMQSHSFLSRAVEVTGAGTAQATLNMGDLATFRLRVPATADEMRRFAHELSKEVEVGRATVATLAALTARLAERRKALISAAVVGELQAEHEPVVVA